MMQCAARPPGLSARVRVLVLRSVYLLFSPPLPPPLHHTLLSHSHDPERRQEATNKHTLGHTCKSLATMPVY